MLETVETEIALLFLGTVTSDAVFLEQGGDVVVVVVDDFLGLRGSDGDRGRGQNKG